jgi:NADH-quinone oxidoreductase subunit L
MKGEVNYNRYFSFLGFFTFSMLGIVLADNLLMVFIFWELVGFSSFLLIGFWFHKPAAAYAARKAFIVNRIGDLGFLVALMTLWSMFGTLDIQEIKVGFAELAAFGEGNFQNHEIWLFVAGAGIFSGAVGKSAQFPLLVWLPDAMEGPTPVSALIHAATMVAAGVYLLARTFALLTMPILDIILITGTLTAFMGAVAALTQNDIKKVLAYSTISQLGFMVMGIGAGARDAALFHLFTHAFFKAGLFLSAGMIIKSFHELEHQVQSAGIRFDAQDMRNMGGLRSRMPVVFISFLLCAAALAGLPLFSGFLSKDAILTGAMAWADSHGGSGFHIGWLIPIAGFLTALLTAFYISRTAILTFFGEFRLLQKFPGQSEIISHLHQRPRVAGIPVLILAVLSGGIFFSVNPLYSGSSWLLEGIRSGTGNIIATSSLEFGEIISHSSEKFHLVTAILSALISIAGIGAGFLIVGRKKFLDRYHSYSLPENIVTGLSYKNWHLDLVYERIFVKPFTRIAFANARFDRIFIDKLVDLAGITGVILGQIIGWFDKTFIDGLVNGLASLAGRAGNIARSIQSGKIQSYYVWTMTALILIILWWLI